jgi:uncharacterized membrane protein YccC
LIEAIKGLPVPSSQLKRAERSIQAIRDQAELPPETADALQELVDNVRTIEGRLSQLEGKGHPHSSDELEPAIEISTQSDGPSAGGELRPSGLGCRDRHDIG